MLSVPPKLGCKIFSPDDPGGGPWKNDSLLRRMHDLIYPFGTDCKMAPARKIKYQTNSQEIRIKEKHPAKKKDKRTRADSLIGMRKNRR